MDHSILNLKDRDLQGEGKLVVEGTFLLERLLHSGWPVEHIWCSEAVYGTYGFPDHSFTVLSREDLSRVAGYSFHRGVLALARAPHIPSLQDSGPVHEPGILVLPRLGDPENLGALFRTALALGVRTVFLGPGNPWPFGRKALRSAMGAQFKLNLRHFDSPGELFGWDRGERKILASSLGRDSLPLGKTAYPEGWLLLMGHEGQGLDREYLSGSDIRVMIPQSEEVDSLNVNAAAAILLHHLQN